MTPTSTDVEPACPELRTDAQRAARGAPSGAALRIERRRFDDLDRHDWDRLAAANPWATPFSAWAFHRAWWDAYGSNAHEHSLVALRGEGDAAELVGIVPLMHRHEVEEGDEERHTTLRHERGASLTPVPPTATAIFFGASYHADYATVLCKPADLPAIADAVVEHLAATADAAHPDGGWDVVDLRRLRCGDPTVDALARAFGALEMAQDWTLNVEREDVCPVMSLPVGATFDDVCANLTKKTRHEIRRKVRRAEAAGELALVESREPLADLEAFIDLHQKRWGADGLFPAGPGGDQSRLFARRLFELFGPSGALRLSFLTVGGQRIAAGIHFETADTVFYYNAGIDPDARDLSPGVVLIERMVRRALARGQRRLDFLRGDEPYKYEWGAVDEPIQRLLVRRAVA